MIVKFLQFIQPEKFTKIQQELIVGHLHILDWRPDRYTTVKTLQLMFEQLGGMLWKYWQFEEPAAVAAPPDEDEVSEKKRILTAGFQFIKDEAPRGNFDCEQLLWTEHQMVDPSSPVYTFKRELVEKVLRKISERDNFAVKQTYYPCLLGDIRPEYMGMVLRGMLLCTTRML